MSDKDLIQEARGEGPNTDDLILRLADALEARAPEVAHSRTLEDWSVQTKDRMRAALTAAQEAAPQAESADCARDHMGICKRCGMGWSARKVLDGDFACPVLSSSDVDEEKNE